MGIEVRDEVNVVGMTRFAVDGAGPGSAHGITHPGGVKSDTNLTEGLSERHSTASHGAAIDAPGEFVAILGA